MRSARLPGSSEPVRWPRCSARAPRRVAMASASRAGSAVGSPPMPLASSAASRISSNMSRSLFDAGPSVPMPTSSPSSQHPRDRRDAGAELQVARRVVRDAGAGVLQRAHLAVVHVHAVRGQHLRVEQALLLHPGNDRHAVRRGASPRPRAASRRGACAAARRTRRRARRTRAGSRACRCRARAAPAPGRSAGGRASAR